MAIGMIVRWRTDEWQRIWTSLRYALIGCLVLGLPLVAMLAEVFIWRAAAGVVLALWIILGTMLALRERLRNSPGLLAGLIALPAAYTGMSLAHLGFAFAIIGISITSQYSTELHTRLGPGDTAELAGYTFELETLREVQGPNYTATEGVFNIRKGNDPVTILHSQKRFYPVVGTSMTEAGIDGGLFRDLYISLGEPLDGDDWSVRLYHRPFVRWIWLGAIFMTFGGLVAASDRRYRVKVEHTGLIPGGLSSSGRP
jgi:cytochrome c-type biogenesis protein CcmF